MGDDWRERVYTFRGREDGIITITNLPDRIHLPTSLNHNPENNLSLDNIIRPQRARAMAPELAYVLRTVSSNDPLLGRICLEPDLLRPTEYANGWALHDNIRFAWLKLEKGLTLISELLLTLTTSPESSPVVRSQHWSPPSAFGYVKVHHSPHAANAAIKNAHLAMCVLAGRLSMAIALWLSDRPEVADVPAWISFLRRHSIPESWIDALQSSAISRFDHGLRAGAFIEPEHCQWLAHVPCYLRAKVPVITAWPTVRAAKPGSSFLRKYPQVAALCPISAVDANAAYHTPPRHAAPDIYRLFFNGEGRNHPFIRAVELRLATPPSGPFQKPGERPETFFERMAARGEEIMRRNNPCQAAARQARVDAVEAGEGPRPWTRVYAWKKIKDVFPDVFEEWHNLDYRAPVASSAAASIWLTYPHTARWYNAVFDEWDLCESRLHPDLAPPTHHDHRIAQALPQYEARDITVLHDDLEGIYPSEDPIGGMERITFPETNVYLRERYGLLPVAGAVVESSRITFTEKHLHKLFALPNSSSLTTDVAVKKQYIYWAWHLLGCPQATVPHHSTQSSSEEGEIKERPSAPAERAHSSSSRGRGGGRSRVRRQLPDGGGRHQTSSDPTAMALHAVQDMAAGNWPCWDLSHDCPAFLLTANVREKIKLKKKTSLHGNLLYEVRYADDRDNMGWVLVLGISSLLYVLRKLPAIQNSSEAVVECLAIGASHYTVSTIVAGDIPTSPAYDSSAAVPIMYRQLEDRASLSDIALGPIDYRAYRMRALLVLSGGTQLRAALAHGNIVWRVARELISSNDALWQLAQESAVIGPMLGRGDSSWTEILPRENDTLFIDNCLTPAEADILCGVYKVYSHNMKQSEDLSWWPKAHAWTSSGMNTALWNAWNEDWFQKRLSQIHDGAAQPMNGTAWRRALKMYLDTNTLAQRASLAAAVALDHAMNITNST